MSQLAAMEKSKAQKEAEGEIETHHPGYLGCQDTFYVGHFKGVGRIYQQTFIDSYSKVAMVKLYDRKNALVGEALTTHPQPAGGAYFSFPDEETLADFSSRGFRLVDMTELTAISKRYSDTLQRNTL